MTSYFKNLPTMAEAEATRRVVPKHELPTKVDKALAKKADTAKDERELRVWARKVKIRDEWKDRYTGKPVKGTRQADPDRAEAHHLEPRSNHALRYDVRNGLTLSMASHDLVERNKIEIIGTRWFRVKGSPTKYIDATHKVTFKEKKPV